MKRKCDKQRKDTKKQQLEISKILLQLADPSPSDTFFVKLLEIGNGQELVNNMLRELMKIVREHPVHDLDNLINSSRVKASSFYKKMMSGIKILDASNVFQISPEYTIILIAQIAAISPTLHTIKMHDNDFGAHGVAVAKALAKSLSLRNIDFSYNGLKEENCIEVINALLELPVLNTIYMIENIMTEIDDRENDTLTVYLRDHQGEDRIQKIIDIHNNEIVETVALVRGVMKDFVCNDVVDVIIQYCEHPEVELILDFGKSEYSDSFLFS